MEKRVKEFLDGFSVNFILANAIAATVLLLGLVGLIIGGWQGLIDVMVILLVFGGIAAVIFGLLWLCFYIEEREDE